MLIRSLGCIRDTAVLAWTIASTLVAHPAEAATTSAAVKGATESRGLWRPEWRRAATWEYFAAGAAIGGGLSLRFLVPQADVNWRGGILFDDAVLDATAIQDLDDRNAMVLASDIVFVGAMVYRAVDSLVLPLAIHHDPDLALQMSITDLEAFGTVAITLWGAQVFVVRERPVVERRCSDPAVSAEIGTCDPESASRGRSFIAGHTAVVLAAAGTTCMHHSHIPLYGGVAGDVVACAAMIGASAFSAVSRFTIESHYPSDVVFGLALGAGAGWIVPMALRYGFGGDPESRTALRVVPSITRERSGVMLVGAF